MVSFHPAVAANARSRRPRAVAKRVGAFAGLTAICFTVASPALAAAPSTAGLGGRTNPPARTELHVAVYGNDPCPTGQGGEIVVCARLPESERYRIPKRLRDEKAAAHVEQSWVARSRIIDQAGAENRPDSCSAVGSGGQTGCFQKFMRDARAQREADKAARRRAVRAVSVTRRRSVLRPHGTAPPA